MTWHVVTRWWCDINWIDLNWLEGIMVCCRGRIPPHLNWMNYLIISSSFFPCVCVPHHFHHTVFFSYCYCSVSSSCSSWADWVLFVSHVWKTIHSMFVVMNIHSLAGALQILAGEYHFIDEICDCNKWDEIKSSYNFILSIFVPTKCKISSYYRYHLTTMIF